MIMVCLKNLKIGLIYAPMFIRLFCHLIKIVSISAYLSNKLSDFWDIYFHYISINCHFS